MSGFAENVKLEPGSHHTHHRKLEPGCFGRERRKLTVNATVCGPHTLSAPHLTRIMQPAFWSPGSSASARDQHREVGVIELWSRWSIGPRLRDAKSRSRSSILLMAGMSSDMDHKKDKE